MTYPNWAYFPRQSAAPDWVEGFLSTVESHRDQIDSRNHRKFESDDMVAAIRPSLITQGWLVEAGKKADEKIHRPVLFGDNGQVRVKQELDGWHPEFKIVLEIEAGRATQGNAIYRDIVRASLVADAEYLALGVRIDYTFKSGANDVTSADFDKTRDALDSIFASGRLILPFKGVLVFGW
jgi:hypothetical protein